MTLVQQVARPMLAGMFIVGGLDSARHPEGKVKAADRVVGGLTGRFDAVETHHLVRANGIAQVAAGTALAIGIMPRTASLVLAASLVPTTFAGHRFWDEDEPATKRQQTIHFLKNVAMMGGLLLAATDTGGRPSVPWRTKRAMGHAASAVAKRAPRHS